MGMNISIFGCGYVGAVTGASFVELGNRMVFQRGISVIPNTQSSKQRWLFLLMGFHFFRMFK